MFRAKARVQERLRDAVSDPVASADLLKMTADLIQRAASKALALPPQRRVLPWRLPYPRCRLL